MSIYLERFFLLFSYFILLLYIYMRDMNWYKKLYRIICNIEDCTFPIKYIFIVCGLNVYCFSGVEYRQKKYRKLKTWYEFKIFFYVRLE